MYSRQWWTLLHLCKYFCRGTDAVKSTVLWNCDFFPPSFFWFPWIPPPWVGVFWVFLFVLFCIIHLVELILLAERVWNNISHVIFVEEKLFEFFFVWFSLPCIHCKHLSCASSELVQNFLYL